MISRTLEHLVLHLLALAEAAKRLSPEVRERLVQLAAEVDANEEALALVSTRLATELYRDPAGREALAAWDALAPERYGLSLDAIRRELNNPGAEQASGAQPLKPLNSLAQITQEALQDPVTFSRKEGLLRSLARLVNLPWPRPGRPVH